MKSVINVSRAFQLFSESKTKPSNIHYITIYPYKHFGFMETRIYYLNAVKVSYSLNSVCNIYTYLCIEKFYFFLAYFS